MDKETMFFLVSESRILGYSNDPDCEEFADYIKDAIACGDRVFNVLEIDITVTLADWQPDPDIEVKYKDTTDAAANTRLAQAISEQMYCQHYEFWNKMPEGIYRVRRIIGDTKLMEVFIEYCPDISNDNWQKVEEVAWKQNA